MEKFSFGVDPITTHAWNHDRTQIAVSANNNLVDIYQKCDDGWEKTHTLSEHTQRVTSVDWAPKSNMIVTCGSDRNAYVWIQNGNNEWKPSLVILRINRAATCVRWSPLENKFAVGSGSRLISICYFDQDHDWWVSKHIKKPIRSTVTTVDWHPNNILLACGSTDFKVRVFSAYVKDIEAKPSGNVWGSKLPLGACLMEFGQSGGWVHDVSFDASGNRLAWVSHDSTINMVNATADFAVSQTKLANLPCMTLQWVGPDSIVAGGHDCWLLRFSVDESNNLTFEGRVGFSRKRTEEKVTAMSMFQSMDKRATVEDDSKRTSIHQNSIVQVLIHSGGREAVTKLSSVGADGLLVVWNQHSLQASIGGSTFNMLAETINQVNIASQD
ncbi:actin-related protein 2/3 complex subunit 1A-A-like [Lytechinus pictus]|uniref:actin-related protein 2/3 complex subunit 1A-A-like n=1 Tax=Lytechinus pictus TaxID=7653 RepID=UPI00240D9380|nr:actin-related protein 2/3 complex subunit 1A-A-like [Lytechinus pictus]